MNYRNEPAFTARVRFVIVDLGGEGALDRIETERLLLRRFEIGDVVSAHRFMTNAETSRYTGDAGFVKTLGDAEKVITDIWLSDYKKYGYGRLALIEKASQELIGFCGPKYLPEFDLPELGYRMLPEYWGRGYATESSKAVMDHALDTLKIEKIMAVTDPENAPSKNVLLKLGFIEKEAVLYMGSLSSHLVYEAAGR